ncbi:monovalent cation/H+ antiporter subunit E [Halopelagius longus]|uniref:Monovalent cation/H+ antiporter subunit E n=1 Tax=Halopelagius longus TaxID=1236180 RepID=A0A1H1BZ71_9EURY|nr:monovalent cation/H+ antiporter subunit E [Halopelagius longus]RDI70991.1 monovalent cation/H+ antiporter subunit E [Halopelagius longus]SDQ57263.1 multisubunit sodium/proton antiporter, MrpE subunit [Halopelagius longus]
MSDASPRILVPAGESMTFRNTVAYAVREARSVAEETGEQATVHFVYPARWQLIDQEEPSAARAEELLDRARVWAETDLDYDEDGRPDEDVPVLVETAVVGQDRYLFSPGDFADVLVEYAHENGLDRVIVDPEYQPGGSAPMLQPFETELARTDLAVEEAPVERRTRRGRLLARASLSKAAATFGAAYVFYLLVGGTFASFDLLTGALTAALAALFFSRVALVESPTLRKTPVRLARACLYVPYLLWEIAKANLSVAYLILHPSLPIDPGMSRFRAAVSGDLPVTTLANSITLTPGTLTVDVGRDGLLVHSLDAGSRDDLAEGALERAVRFLFYGRGAARIPTPTERGSIADEDERGESSD